MTSRGAFHRLLGRLTAALFEDEQLDTIECESAEAALATLLIGGRLLFGCMSSVLRSRA
jgi:hypothetical protein